MRVTWLLLKRYSNVSRFFAAFAKAKAAPKDGFRSPPTRGRRGYSGDGVDIGRPPVTTRRKAELRPRSPPLYQPRDGLLGRGPACVVHYQGFPSIKS